VECRTHSSAQQAAYRKVTLSGIECGLALFTIATLARIARGLGVTSAHVMTFPEDSPLEALLDEVLKAPPSKKSE